MRNLLVLFSAFVGFLSLAPSAQAQDFEYYYTLDVNDATNRVRVSVYARKTNAAAATTYMGNQNFTLVFDQTRVNTNPDILSITTGPFSSLPFYTLGAFSITPTTVGIQINRFLPLVPPGQEITVAPRLVVAADFPLVGCGFDPSAITWGATNTVSSYTGANLTAQFGYANATATQSCNFGTSTFTTLTDKTAYCPGETVQVTVNSSATYQAYQLYQYDALGPDALVASGNSNVMSFVGAQPGDSLYVVVRNCICTRVLGVGPLRFANVNVDLGPDTSACGNSVTLDAGNPSATSWDWYTLPGNAYYASGQFQTISTPGTYRAVVDSGGCSDADTIAINFLPTKAVNMPLIGAQCPGTPITGYQPDIVPAAGLPTVSSYEWIGGQTTPSITVNGPGYQEVTVTFSNGCTASGDTVIGFLPLPSVSITSPSLESDRYVDTVASTLLFNQRDMVESPSGDIFITVAGSANAVYRLQPNGALSLFASLPATPAGITMGPTGDLYVACIGDNTIRRITPGGTVSLFAGVAGSPTTGPLASTYLDTDDPLTALFNQPEGIDVDAVGNIYICDNGNNCVRVILADGRVRTIGVPNNVGGPATSGTLSTATFNKPHSIKVAHDGRVYVGASARIHRIDVNNNQVNVFLTSGLAPDPVTSFIFGIDETPQGNLLVSSSGQNAIFEINPSLSSSTRFAGDATGTASYLTGTAGHFFAPGGIFLAKDGRLLVAQNATSGPNNIRYVSDSAFASFCAGDSTLLTGVGVGPGAYAWNTGATSASIYASTPGTYYVTFQSFLTGCSSTDTIRVYQRNSPVFASITPDSTICLGGSITLSASTVSGTDSLSIEYPLGSQLAWGYGSVSLPGVTNAPRTYYVVATGAGGGCSVVDSIVLDRFDPAVSAGPDAGYCTGSGVNLVGSVTSGPWTTTQLWSTTYPGVIYSPSAASATPFVTIPPVSGTQVIRFFLTVSQVGSTCTKADSVDITIYANPVVLATGDTTICSGGSTVLGVNVVSGTPATVTPYLWSPNDGSLSSITSATPTATPTDTTTYTLTFTDNQGCQTTDIITVRPVDFAVTLGLADTICRGSSITLTPTVTTPVVGPYTYIWTPTGSFTNPNLPSQTVSPTVATTYSVSVTDTELGCSANANKTIRINSLTVDAVDSVFICHGSTGAALSSTVTGGQMPYIYAWSGPGLSSTSIANPTANPPASGRTVYYLTVTDSKTPAGCSRIDSSVVYRQPQLAVSLGPDRYSCSSSPAVALTATVTQPGIGGPYSATWSVPLGDPAITFTPPTGLSTSAVGTADGRAIVTLTDAAGPACAVRDTVFIDRITLAAAITPPPGPFCKKADYVLSGSQTGAATPLNVSYSWQSGAVTTQNLTYVNAQRDSLFTLTVTDNTSGCIASTNYGFVVNTLTINVPADTTICFEGTVTFNPSGVTGGVTPYNLIQWWHSDVSGLVPPGSGTQAMPVGYQGVAGINNTYYLVVRDAAGCRDSTVWRARRNNQIGAIAGIANGSAPFPNQFCMGTALQPGGASSLLVNSGATGSGGVSPYNYLWTVTSGPNLSSAQFGNAIAEKPGFTATTPGLYTIRVRVTDAVGCLSTVGAPTVSFTMLPTPTVSINQGDSVALCTGDNLNLTATSNLAPTAGNTTWRNSANTVLNPWSFTGSGPYTVSLTNPITSGDTITIRVNNGTCSGYDTIRVYQFTPPSITGINVFQGACTSDTIKVTANFTPSNLGTPSWSHNGFGTIVAPSGSDDTLSYLPSISDVNVTYSVTYSNLCGTSAPANVGLALTVTPSVDIDQGTQVTFCSGGSAVLTATSDLAPTPANTTWTNSVGATLPWTAGSPGPPTYGINLDNPITTTDTIVVEVIRFPCIALDTIFIYEILPPSITGINVFQGTCSNDTVKVTATFAPQPGTISWSHTGFGDVVGSTDSEDTLIYLPNDIDPTPLDFLVMYDNGCNPVANDLISHSPTPAPLASFDVTPGTTFVPGDILSFNNTSTNPAANPVTLNWNFGTGANPSQIVVDAVDNSPYLIDYPTADTRTVSLVVVDNVTSCEDSTSLQIGGGETRALFVPNVFSPFANNPENQTLKVYGFNISAAEFRFTVYNRWGQLVYETSSLSEASSLGWDGTSRATGRLADVGVYTYTVQGRYFDGTPIQKAGTATLIR